MDRLRTHDVVLVDGSLVLRPFTEDDWSLVAPWNTDPRVLWFSEGGFVEDRWVVEGPRDLPRRVAGGGCLRDREFLCTKGTAASTPPGHWNSNSGASEA